jgi:hypothetical protein
MDEQAFVGFGVGVLVGVRVGIGVGVRRSVGPSTEVLNVHLFVVVDQVQ